jgi:hypothetical protein
MGTPTKLADFFDILLRPEIGFNGKAGVGDSPREAVPLDTRRNGTVVSMHPENGIGRRSTQ